MRRFYNSVEQKYYLEMPEEEYQVSMEVLFKHGAQTVNGCLCLFTEPCTPQCTCAKPGNSGGCGRCAKYGSPEQKQAIAERIAEKIG